MSDQLGNSALLTNFDQAMWSLNTSNTLSNISETISGFIGSNMQSGLDDYDKYNPEEKQQFLSTYSNDTASYLLQKNKITNSDYAKYTSLLDENSQIKEESKQNTIAQDIFMKMSSDASPDEIAEAIGQCLSNGISLEKASEIHDQIYGNSSASKYNRYIAHGLAIAQNAIDNAEVLVKAKLHKNNKRLEARINNQIKEIDAILSGHAGQGFLDSLYIGGDLNQFFKKALPIKTSNSLIKLKQLLIAKKNTT